MSPYFASLSTLVSVWRKEEYRRADRYTTFEARKASFIHRWRVRVLANNIANEENQ